MMMNLRLRSARLPLALPLILVLGACAFAPDSKPPAVTPPAQYGVEATPAAGATAPDGDALAYFVALNDAIARDDPAVVAALIRRAPAVSPNVLMPPIEFMVRWATPVTVTFGLSGDGYIYGVPKEKVGHGWAFRAPLHDGTMHCQLGDDLASSIVSAVYPPCRILPNTPLVRAIRCGACRVVRVLLAAGARADPSPEALLACAIDRLFARTVVMVDHHRTIDHTTGYGPWGALERRNVDGAAIIEDLLATFGRTAPSIGALDINPLSALRRALCVLASSEYHIGENEEPPDGPLSRLDRALSRLIAAGYSPDERVSAMPQQSVVYGFLKRDDSNCAVIQGPRLRNEARLVIPPDVVDDARRACLVITEREAAVASFDEVVPKMIYDMRARHMVIARGMRVILAAYEAIPSAILDP